MGKQGGSGTDDVEFIDDGNGGIERAKGAYSSKKHINSNILAIGFIALIAIIVVVITSVTGTGN